VIFLIKKPDEDCNIRIGFIISKKKGGAVLRNKIKRVIKETLRETGIEICSSFDILFKINSNIRDIDFKKLRERLDNYIIPYIASCSRQ
jgi:ribonuclease P protein component